MPRPDAQRGAWLLPAMIWVVGCVVLVGVGFGTKTRCTTTRPEAECGVIDDWAWFGLIAAGLVALLPVSRSLREQATPLWVTAAVGVVIGATMIGMYSV